MRCVTYAAAAASLLSPCMALAQSAAPYPGKPVRMVVTFTPGGATDVIGRIVAQKLGELWGQQVIVDNRPGTGGALGTELVAKSPPDGYTIVLSSFGPMAIAPYVYHKLAYDPVKDLAPITLAATSWYFMAVTPSLPVKSVREFIALAKSRPGEITYSSSGNASPTHLSGALFAQSAGIKLTHVPYKGAAPGIAAVVSGEVQMAIESPPPIVPQVKAGKLRALAAARRERSPLLPDVPTMTEAGLKGFEAGSWYGFHAPAGTPKAIIDKLHADMVKIMALPDVRQGFANVGGETIANTPAQYGAFVESELRKWGGVIKSTGIKVD
ncbi:MAG TPA: tripartite tricarboxylate transporter substrate binding protein [Burkholderiales bacterium]|nr:tripartite tricarboxylate transporter substrate binding protein [Burkholderiales bacterium]